MLRFRVRKRVRVRFRVRDRVSNRVRVRVRVKFRVRDRVRNRVRWSPTVLPTSAIYSCTVGYFPSMVRGYWVTTKAPLSDDERSSNSATHSKVLMHILDRWNNWIRSSFMS